MKDINSNHYLCSSKSINHPHFLFRWHFNPTVEVSNRPPRCVAVIHNGKIEGIRPRSEKVSVAFVIRDPVAPHGANGSSCLRFFNSLAVCLTGSRLVTPQRHLQILC